MENFNQDGGYDYRHYDRIWQRVAPHLDPYPEVRAELASGGGPMGVAGVVSMPSGATGLGEGNLPGAQMDPCCMGSSAQISLAVLVGFLEEELADARYYYAFAQRAPTAAAGRLLRVLAQAESGHARRLMAIYYLITGTCYRPNLSCEHIQIPPWCQALRERYHAEACGGFNYIRAADETTDPCLTKLLTELSEDEYRHAQQLLELLEQSMGKMPTCTRGYKGL